MSNYPAKFLVMSCHTLVLIVFHTYIHLRLVIQHHYKLKHLIIYEYFL